jgi:hypothetical protein
MMNNTSQSGKRHRRNQPEMGKIAKRDVCNSFVGVFTSLVQKAVNDFFFKVYFNDPECDILMRGKGMLSKQEKQDLASSEAIL